MEWFKFMANAQGRQRLANIEVQDKTRRKNGNTASGKGTKAATSARKSAHQGTKAASGASKQRMKNQTNTKKKKISVEENPLSRRTSQVYSHSQAPRRPRVDAYDAPVRQAQRRPSGVKVRRRRKNRGFSGFSVLLMLLILGFGGLGVWRVQEYKAFAEMKAVVSRQTFYEGTTVEGIDVSRMTLTQALEYWEEQVEPGYRETAAVLNDGTRVTAGQMGYSSNYADVLTGAWNAGRSGSLKERYARMTRQMLQPSAHQVMRSFCNEELVREYVADVARQVNTQPRDARVKSFDTDSCTFEFEAEQPGYTLNQEALTADIRSALFGGGGNVQMQVEAVAPALTLENVAAQYGMITSAVTNASSSSSNRLSNIRLALSSINGVSLEPGQTFSFNEIVGRRTAERGYKSATAYSGGKVTEELGGGICQVSTTLFNAAVKANLEINERHPHSLTVSYVDLGKDAAVDWGNKDLRFTNNSDDRVYLCGYLTDDKRVRIGVFGRLLPDGMSITVEGVQTGTRDYETQYQMSFELSSGETRVLQKGKKGYTAMAYKILWDANGNEIRRSELCKSNYQSTPEIIEYGP